MSLHICALITLCVSLMKISGHILNQLHNFDVIIIYKLCHSQIIYSIFPPYTFVTHPTFEKPNACYSEEMLPSSLATLSLQQIDHHISSFFPTRLTVHHFDWLSRVTVGFPLCHMHFHQRCQNPQVWWAQCCLQVFIPCKCFFFFHPTNWFPICSIADTLLCLCHPFHSGTWKGKAGWKKRCN